MPKQPIITTTEIASLVQQVREIILSARAVAARSVDTVQVAMNFAIGQRIVEHEQGGDKRAAYGKQVMEHLAQTMTSEFGRGFSATNLRLMRQFYLAYSPRILQTPSGELSRQEIHQTASDGSALFHELANARMARLAQLPGLASISWSHYVFLMSIANPDERMFYEIESAQQGWDVRTLKRQVSSCLYERLALSRDKEGVERLASEGDLPQASRQLIKDPLVLEFLVWRKKLITPNMIWKAPSSTGLNPFCWSLARAFFLRLAKSVFPSARTTFTSIWSFSIVYCAATC